MDDLFDGTMGMDYLWVWTIYGYGLSMGMDYLWALYGLALSTTGTI